MFKAQATKLEYIMETRLTAMQTGRGRWNRYRAVVNGKLYRSLAGRQDNL